ncbi:MAG: amino acid adenylation domain-containing protein, partial [bacterium]|nr:amino acid adenylation domain-containing protein [bacterium]
MENKTLSEEMVIAASQSLKEKKYWNNALSGEINKTGIPFDKRPGTQKNTAIPTEAAVKTRITGGLFQRLMKISNNSNPRLHMILVAAAVALLNKYTGAGDIIIGTTIDKQKSGAEFINTILPLRHAITPESTFKDLLLEARKTINGAIEHQNYPLEAMLNQVNMTYSANDFPLFDMVVLLENLHDKNYLQDLKPNIVMSFNKDVQEVTMQLEYRRELYEESTIEKIGRHFTRLLEQVLTEPNRELKNIELLSPEKRKQLLDDFNDTTTPYPQETIQQLFEQQVEKTPGATALRIPGAGSETNRSGYDALTYSDLNEKAAALARTLRAKGIRAETLCAICAPPSIEAVIGILAILKAGGAYLPIDPKTAEKRIEFMLTDSRAALLLTLSNHTTNNDSPIPVLQIDEDANYIEENGEPTPAAAPHNLAYIIYTSGTTGRPKGVMIEQRGLVNYVNWAAKTYIKGETFAFPFFTSIAFDFTVTTIYPPLVTGNTIIVYDDEIKEMLVEQVIRDNQVGILKVTPSHLKLIRSMGQIKSTVKRIITGGEDLEAQLAADIFDNFNGDVEIYNEYGPTEAVVGCLIHKYNRQEAIKTSVSIGKPIDNTHIYILDKHQKPIPEGAVGELYIAGDGLARGYLSRPQLTTEKFIFLPGTTLAANEKTQNDGKGSPLRLYKTGDRAKWQTGGTIRFLGRIDQQVKIRGYRVECGEIENLLLRHSGINEAAVTASKGKDGETALCAYYTAGDSIALPELRQHLAAELTDYMIPTYFVQIPKIPLTPHGKIDHRALPDPEKSQQDSGIDYVPPTNEVETQLTEIWEKVIGRKKIGITEDFFMIGGDSIKSIQIVSRMKAAGFNVKMQDIFSNPSIAGLAANVEKTKHLADQSTVTGQAPLTPIQAAYFLEPGPFSLHFNQSVMLLYKDGIEKDAVTAIFSKLQEHHDALRFTYEEKNGAIIQTNRGLDYPLFVQEYDLRGQNPQEAVTQLENRAAKIKESIDIRQGPLMKTVLFHTDDGDRLLIVVHHLVIDGVSWRILFEDIDTLYRQYHDQQPMELPPKTDSFKKWAGALARYANSSDFAADIQYWETLEHENIPSLNLDIKNEKDKNQIKDTAVTYFQLSHEETRALLTETNRAFGTRINDILLTALGLAFKDELHTDRMLINLEGHGREEILPDVDISRTVCWFTSVYPVLLDMTHAQNLARQLKEV